MYVLIIAALILGFSVFSEEKISKAGSRYSKVFTLRNMTGRQVAEMILNAEGISDVKVVRLDSKTQTIGSHYNSARKCIGLTPKCYDERSIVAVATAAHEAGHAIQDHEAYFPFKIRMFMAPVGVLLNFVLPLFLIVGLFVFSSSEWDAFAGVLTAIYLFLAVFYFMELPVEFNASRRARQRLAALEIVGRGELYDVEKYLAAAAFTYTAIFAIQLVQVLSFAFRTVGRFFLILYLFTRRKF